MKKYLALLCALCLVLSLCACSSKKPASGSDLASGTDVPENVTELSYLFGQRGLSFIRSDGAGQLIELTSITLRPNCSICTYLRGRDETLSLDFPELAAKTADGQVFYLKPDVITDGTVCFEECPELPVADIVSISAGDATIDLTSGTLAGSTDDKGRLNRVSSMSWQELFSYCLSNTPGGVGFEGAYGELARRMKAQPEEFALRLLCPAYDFGESALTWNATADVITEFYDAYGFDSKLEQQICQSICSACLAPDVAAAVDTLETSGGFINERVASLLTEALTHIR